MARQRGRTLQFSNFSDATGSEIFDLTIMMVAVATLGLTAGQLGILNALGTVSFLLLAVPLGAVVDHVGPWRILLLSLTCKTFLIALGTALYLTGHLTPVAVMVLVTLFGIVVVATENSQVSIVPLVMGDNDDAAGIVSLMSSADRLARIAAPAVVGLLVARGHALIALTIAIGMLIVAVLTALLLRPDRPTIDSSETSSEGDGSSSDSEKAEVASGTKFARLRHQLTHGFHVIWENKVLRAVVLLVTAGNMGLAISDSTLSILILRELALGPAFLECSERLQRCPVWSARQLPRRSPKLPRCGTSSSSARVFSSSWHCCRWSP